MERVLLFFTIYLLFSFVSYSKGTLYCRGERDIFIENGETNKTYFLVNSPLNWTSAFQYCWNSNGFLPPIPTSTARDYFVNMLRMERINSSKSIWIGFVSLQESKLPKVNNGFVKVAVDTDHHQLIAKNISEILPFLCESKSNIMNMSALNDRTCVKYSRKKVTTTLTKSVYSTIPSEQSNTLYHDQHTKQTISTATQQNGYQTTDQEQHAKQTVYTTTQQIGYETDQEHAIQTIFTSTQQNGYQTTDQKQHAKQTIYTTTQQIGYETTDQEHAIQTIYPATQQNGYLTTDQEQNTKQTVFTATQHNGYQTTIENTGSVKFGVDATRSKSSIASDQGYNKVSPNTLAYSTYGKFTLTTSLNNPSLDKVSVTNFLSSTLSSRLTFSSSSSSRRTMSNTIYSSISLNPTTSASKYTTHTSQQTTSVPNTSSPFQQTTSVPNTSRPSQQTTSVPSTSRPSQQTTSVPSTSRPSQQTTSVSSTSRPSQQTTSVSSTSRPSQQTTSVSSTSRPSQQTTPVLSTSSPSQQTTSVPSTSRPSKETTSVPSTSSPSQQTTSVPSTSSPSQKTTSVPSTSRPSKQTTSVPSTSRPSQQTTPVLSTSSPSQQTTSVPSTSSPSQQTTSVPSISSPSQQTTSVPSISSPSQQTTSVPNTSSPSQKTPSVPSTSSPSQQTTSVPSTPSPSQQTTSVSSTSRPSQYTTFVSKYSTHSSQHTTPPTQVNTNLIEYTAAILSNHSSATPPTPFVSNHSTKSEEPVAFSNSSSMPDHGALQIRYPTTASSTKTTPKLQIVTTLGMPSTFNTSTFSLILKTLHSSGVKETTQRGGEHASSSTPSAFVPYSVTTRKDNNPSSPNIVPKTVSIFPTHMVTREENFITSGHTTDIAMLPKNSTQKNVQVIFIASVTGGTVLVMLAVMLLMVFVRKKHQRKIKNSETQEHELMRYSSSLSIPRVKLGHPNLYSPMGNLRRDRHTSDEKISRIDNLILINMHGDGAVNKFHINLNRRNPQGGVIIPEPEPDYEYIDEL